MTTRRTSASAKAHSRKRNHDGRVTLAQRLGVVRQLRQEDGNLYRTKPANRLIGRYPAETIKHCADAINSLAEPNAWGAMMYMIADALEHAEKVIREGGAEADFEREARA